jgi:hypothetical protein
LNRSPWYGPERPKWLGPLPHQYADWLPQDAPGNYGFDIARLSQSSGKFDKYFELELLHARWAMLGALGAVLPGSPYSRPSAPSQPRHFPSDTSDTIHPLHHMANRACVLSRQVLSSTKVIICMHIELCTLAMKQ